jgi:hypothetical protein
LHRTSRWNGRTLVDTQELAVEPTKIMNGADSHEEDSTILIFSTSEVETLCLADLAIVFALGHLILVELALDHMHLVELALDHMHLVELALGNMVMVGIYITLDVMDSITGSSILFKILRTSQQD